MYIDTIMVVKVLLALALFAVIMSMARRLK
jgi:hypothetical protein